MRPLLRPIAATLCGATLILAAVPPVLAADACSFTKLEDQVECLRNAMSTLTARVDALEKRQPGGAVKASATNARLDAKCSDTPKAGGEQSGPKDNDCMPAAASPARK